VLDEDHLDEPQYFISSFSQGGDCVAVAKSYAGDYLVRHSRSNLPPILFTPSEWKAFVAGVKAHEFDF
jgi:hypothetical protein